MNPRERAGQDSIARAAPAGHSAPMPMPSSARNRKRNQNAGEKPAMKLQIEYQRIEIISGVLRPIRSASHPEPTAPTSRSHKVTLSKNATSVSGTPNSCEIGTMISRNIVKSNASNVQPSQDATQAYHWSFVGSFHQGIGVPAGATAVLIADTFSLNSGGQSANAETAGPCPTPRLAAFASSRSSSADAPERSLQTGRSNRVPCRSRASPA